MAAKKIDYDTILACKQGDSEALNRVLVHYDNGGACAHSHRIAC